MHISIFNQPIMKIFGFLNEFSNKLKILKNIFKALEFFYFETDAGFLCNIYVAYMYNSNRTKGAFIIL